MKTLQLVIPDYLFEQLHMNAATERVTKKYLVLQALPKPAIELRLPIWTRMGVATASRTESRLPWTLVAPIRRTRTNSHYPPSKLGLCSRPTWTLRAQARLSTGLTSPFYYRINWNTN